MRQTSVPRELGGSRCWSGSAWGMPTPLGRSMACDTAPPPFDPFLCHRCEPFCNTGGCQGWFLPEIKAGVNCTVCPTTGCADCEDFSGKCTECRPGLGLVDGECRRCRVPDCKKCDGEPGNRLQRGWGALCCLLSCGSSLPVSCCPGTPAGWQPLVLSLFCSPGDLDVCTECWQPKFLRDEGLYLDAAGNCTQASRKLINGRKCAPTGEQWCGCMQAVAHAVSSLC